MKGEASIVQIFTIVAIVGGKCDTGTSADTETSADTDTESRVAFVIDMFRKLQMMLLEHIVSTKQQNADADREADPEAAPDADACVDTGACSGSDDGNGNMPLLRLKLLLDNSPSVRINTISTNTDTDTDTGTDAGASVGARHN